MHRGTQRSLHTLPSTDSCNQKSLIRIPHTHTDHIVSYLPLTISSSEMLPLAISFISFIMTFISYVCTPHQQKHTKIKQPPPTAVVPILDPLGGFLYQLPQQKQKQTTSTLVNEFRYPVQE